MSNLNHDLWQFAIDARREALLRAADQIERELNRHADPSKVCPTCGDRVAWNLVARLRYLAGDPATAPWPR